MADRVVTTDGRREYYSGLERKPLPAAYESSILGITHIVPKYNFFHRNNCATPREDGLPRKGEDVSSSGLTLDPKDKAPKILVELQETKIEIIEKATETTLERTIFNATILLSVSMVTGFSTWTTSQLTDTTSTQLGSLAILASTASGIAAMLSSAQNLKGIASNSWRYLQTAELILGGKKDLGTDKPVMGFTKKDAKVRSATLLDFWKAKSTARRIRNKDTRCLGKSNLIIS
jgi:hypothetical protein